jgi:hypothetical protein
MEYSNKSRRTLSQALRTDDLSPEALAFLKPTGRSPAPQEMGVVPTPIVREVSRSAAPSPVCADTTHDDILPLARPIDPPPPARPVSMTFRLAPEIPAALLRASVERKVRHQRPFTQQEIVTEAIKHWLKVNGFPA